MRFSSKTSGYNFGSSKYAASFQSLPESNPLELRQRALQYFESYSPQQWYQDPVRFSLSCFHVFMFSCFHNCTVLPCLLEF